MSNFLSEAEWRLLNPQGPVGVSGAPYGPIPIRLIDDYRYEFLGSLAPAGSAAVVTAGSALLSATAIGSTTAAFGTQVDFPRNLIYEINISGDATGMVASGTLSAAGLDIRGSAITETVALTDICSAGSAGYVEGTKIFAALSASALTVSGYELATASSSRSKSISVFVGIGSHVGVPASIQSTGAIPYAFIGTLNQVGSFSVITGDIGTAAVSFSNALATNTPVHILRYVSR